MFSAISSFITMTGYITIFVALDIKILIVLIITAIPYIAYSFYNQKKSYELLKHESKNRRKIDYYFNA